MGISKFSSKFRAIFEKFEKDHKKKNDVFNLVGPLKWLYNFRIRIQDIWKKTISRYLKGAARLGLDNGKNYIAMRRKNNFLFSKTFIPPLNAGFRNRFFILHLDTANKTMIEIKRLSKFTKSGKPLLKTLNRHFLLVVSRGWENVACCFFNFRTRITSNQLTFNWRDENNSIYNHEIFYGYQDG